MQKTAEQIAAMQIKMMKADRVQDLLNHMGATRVEAMIANQVKTDYMHMRADDMNRRGVTVTQRYRQALHGSTILRSGYWIN